MENQPTPLNKRFNLDPLPALHSAIIVALLTPVLLFVHGYDGPGSDFMHMNGWTLFMPMWWYFLLNLVWRKGSTPYYMAIVIALCLVVETLQSINAPWIEELRPTLFGRLFLSRGFDSWDFVIYLVGLDLALIVHLWLGRRIKN